jgi:hypothetical protein
LIAGTTPQTGWFPASKIARNVRVQYYRITHTARCVLGNPVVI